MPDHKTKSSASCETKRSLRPAEFRNGIYCQRGGISYIDLSRNDYLHLSQHPDLIDAARNMLEQSGMGSTGSRLLSGDYTQFHDLERDVAAFCRHESALLFNSGYQCNLSLISTLFGPTDIVFADKHIHASLIDACRLAGVTLKRFSHLDLSHLESRLSTYRSLYQRALILSESLFSMDGDTADIPGLIALKTRFDCQLLIDEAHAFGVLGDSGRGLAASYSGDIDYISATFGKALGSVGAFVACSESVRKQLISSARGFIYSTALPLPVIAWNHAALRLLPDLDARRSHLFVLADWLRSHCQRAGFTRLGNSPIIPLIFDSPDACKGVVADLANIGFHASAIMPPTVPANACRIRLSLSSGITQEILQPLTNYLSTLSSSKYSPR
ncbi:MAG: 8-amino-7-oxononanoate synthase [bacterium]